MTKIRFFLWKYHRVLVVLSLCFMAFGIVGCGPLTWLSDSLQILPIASSMLAAALTLVGALTGSTLPAEIATIVSGVISKAMAGVRDIQAMIAEYKQNPSTTLLTSIEAGVKAVIDGINSFLTDTGITDPATQKKVVDILTLILTEVQALETLLPSLQAKAGTKLQITVPMTSKEAKEAFNAILDTPTGTPAVDAALAKLHRL